jgi:pyridinium-3,5-bisthiocarboxylic acid mononucleotide nickel chelatase
MALFEAEPLWVIEANLDDLSPQLVEVFIQKALESGALDAWAQPVVMKKGRPGLILSALCREAQKEALSLVFFRETTTLGVRSYPTERYSLQREWSSVQTRFGVIRVKVGRLGEEIVNAHPEFEDCRAAAKERGVSVKVVMSAALAAFWTSLDH